VGRTYRSNDRQDARHEDDHRRAKPKLKRLALTRKSGEKLILAVGGIGTRVHVDIVRDDRTGEMRVHLLIEAPGEVAVAREEVATERWLEAVGLA